MANETAIKDGIVRWLRQRGYWVVKTHGEAMQQRGIPDLIACVRGRFVAFEVKDPESGEPSPLQTYELAAIIRAGGVAWVVQTLDDAKIVAECIEDEA